MGGAKRYKSMAAGEGDGFCERDRRIAAKSGRV